jgi:hypothetical protein
MGMITHAPITATPLLPAPPPPSVAIGFVFPLRVLTPFPQRTHARRYMDERPSVFTIIHIVSASPTSTDIREVLLRVCRELKTRFPALEWDEVYGRARESHGLGSAGGRTCVSAGLCLLACVRACVRACVHGVRHGAGGGAGCARRRVRAAGFPSSAPWVNAGGPPLPLCAPSQEEQEDYQAVKDGFFKALELAGEFAIAERCPIVLIVDAVNQLNPFYNALTMDWFPTYLCVLG